MGWQRKGVDRAIGATCGGIAGRTCERKGARISHGTDADATESRDAEGSQADGRWESRSRCFAVDDYPNCFFSSRDILKKWICRNKCWGWKVVPLVGEVTL